MSLGEFSQTRLNIAQQILSAAAYKTSSRDLPDGSEMLVAENPYFVLGIVSCETVQELVRLEQLGSIELANWVAKVDLGPKQWDTCLVLLGSSNTTTYANSGEEMFTINYDLRYIRRLAQLEVAETEDSIKRALAPFLPLPVVRDSDTAVDPLVLLGDELTEHGVTQEDAEQAISEFRLSRKDDSA